ncbi:MAG: methionine adenosyltransferase domain-containing protein [Duncaniella sp.]|nr:methionine adenosyltransferase domain-containing protein [Duncaniella sp.]
MGIRYRSLCVDTRGTAKVNMTDSEIAEVVKGLKCFDMTPYAIEKRFGLRNPIYRETASYGHLGRTPMTVTKIFKSKYEPAFEKTVELFTWEKLDAVPDVKKAFNI